MCFPEFYVLMDTPSSWIIFLLAAFGAEIVGTMAGFGAATILTPVAALFMDVKCAIALVAIFHLFGNASRLVFFGRRIDWKIWLRFGLTGVVCSLAGAAVAVRLPSAIIELSFGIFLLAYVAGSLSSMRLRLRKSSATLMGGGIFSGFIAGFIGTGGAIRSACLMVFDLPKEAYIGTSAAIALVVDATRVPVYLMKQFIPQRMFPLIVSLLFAAFLGSWVGQRLIRHVSAEVFRRFVTVMLLAMALKMLLDGSRLFL